MAKPDLTAERLRELLDYEADTGVFIRRVRRGGTANAGRTAGTVTDGYVQIGVDGTIYKAHRLAWLYFYGRWPENDIDHINGNRGDNRIVNLRDVSRAVNLQNRRTTSRVDKTIPLGVCWQKHAKRWRASIRSSGKVKNLGYFDTPEQAHEAYLKAKRQVHEGCTI